MNKTTFINQSANPAMARAVINQLGGWDSFSESAQDVTSHGADAGFSGFIYYAETLAFTKKHKASIMESINNMAQEIGQPVLEFVQSFRCVGADYSVDEIAQAIYAGKGDAVETIYNALAWYALEEVCREFGGAAV